jgi:hypothetical protein
VEEARNVKNLIPRRRRRTHRQQAPRAEHPRNTGPGRLLIAVYAIFAISATARAGYQILTKFSEAPLAYLLSAFAALVYVVATVSLAKAGRTWFKVSVARSWWNWSACWWWVR